MHESIFITEIKIWNREDLHSDYLSNYQIFIGDNADYSKNTLCKNGNAFSDSQNITCDLQGRYITIRLMGTNYLQLCEVEAYSTPNYSLPEIGSTNLAYRTYTDQYEITNDGESQRAVDGNYSQVWTDSSCTYSAYATNAWWSTDLFQVVNVT